MKVDIYDIETLSTCFTYTGKDRDTGKIVQFIIHESQNEIVELIEHLMQLNGQIGFNNLSFDSQVIEFIMRNIETLPTYSVSKIIDFLYDAAQSAIEKANNSWPVFPEWELTIPQLDLFKIWHFDNKARMTSLKWLEFMMDMESIEEMPIAHNESVSNEQVKSILSYNLNDVIATEKLYNITIGNTNHPLYKGVDRIQLRKDIMKEFGIKCLNYNDVKIGDRINKTIYIQNIGSKAVPKPYKTRSFTFGDCYPSYTKFVTIEFNEFVRGLARVEVDFEKKQDFQFTFNGTTYTIAKGGLHSNDKPRIVIPKENEILIDADVGLNWPN